MPIESTEKLDTCIRLATRLPDANEKMVEAFVLAVWSRDYREFSNS